jgi:hypothetical protein
MARSLRAVPRMMSTLSRTLLAASAALAIGCTRSQSSADQVNRPGTWRLTFTHLKDVDGPPYVVEEPAPEYPPRIITSPVVDSSSCSPGCTCEFQSATENCSGDVSELCRAWGGFVETCPAARTILDCSHEAFDSDTQTYGVCVLEDSTTKSDFGYAQLGRYGITFDRVSYD